MSSWCVVWLIVVIDIITVTSSILIQYRTVFVFMMYLGKPCFIIYVLMFVSSALIIYLKDICIVTVFWLQQRYWSLLPWLDGCFCTKFLWEDILNRHKRNYVLLLVSKFLHVLDTILTCHYGDHTNADILVFVSRRRFKLLTWTFYIKLMLCTLCPSWKKVISMWHLLVPVWF